jgi:uncharacterized membrane protein
MKKVEASITIKRPVEQVFAFISNAENNPKWATGAIEVKKVTEGTVGLGTVWRPIATFLGRRIEGEGHVIEYEPNRLYTVRGEKPFPFELHYRFEGIAGGTRVSLTREAETGGFFKLAEPLMMKTVNKQIQTDLANLKNVLETQVE